MKEMQDLSIHWRESARTPKFFIVDAHAALVVLFILIFPTWWKTMIGLVFLVIFGVLAYFKMPIVVAARKVIGMIAGRKKLRQ